MSADGQVEDVMSMKPTLTGFAFLLGYIVMVGVASFLQKFGMKQLNPYQINFLTANFNSES